MRISHCCQCQTGTTLLPCMIFILYVLLLTEILQDDLLEALMKHMPAEKRSRLQHRRRKAKIISNVMRPLADQAPADQRHQKSTTAPVTHDPEYANPDGLVEVQSLMRLQNSSLVQPQMAPPQMAPPLRCTDNHHPTAQRFPPQMAPPLRCTDNHHPTAQRFPPQMAPPLRCTDNHHPTAQRFPPQMAPPLRCTDNHHPTAQRFPPQMAPPLQCTDNHHPTAQRFPHDHHSKLSYMRNGGVSLRVVNNDDQSFCKFYLSFF